MVEDPWKTRNDYIDVVLDRSHENVAEFIDRQTEKVLSPADEVKFLKLLEIQHHAMLMYTSCAWFFDEVTGIETLQDILYAARAIQLHKDITGTDYEEAFIKLLAKAPSNLPEYGNAAVAYEKLVRPSIVDMNRVGAHYAVSSLFSDYTEHDQVYSFKADLQHFDKHYAGKYRLALGRARLTSEVTWEEEDVTFAVIHLGEHHLFGGVRKSIEESAYQTMHDEIVEAFQKSRVHEAIVLMDKHFGMHNYSFWHLFKEDQQELLNRVLNETMSNVEGTFRQIYESNYSVLQAMKQLGIHAPRPLRDAGEFTINSKVKRMLERDFIDPTELKSLVESIENLGVEINTVGLSFLAGERINYLMEKLEESPNDLTRMKQIVQFIKACYEVHLQPDLWKAQNIAFIIHRENYARMVRKQDQGEEQATQWLNTFVQLFEVLNIHMANYALIPQI